MTRLTDAELAELLAGITLGPWHIDKRAASRIPDLLADLIAAREALRKISTRSEPMSEWGMMDIAREALGE